MVEWVFCWMGFLCWWLWELGGGDGLMDGLYLVFFLYDEVIVYMLVRFVD